MKAKRWTYPPGAGQEFWAGVYVEDVFVSSLEDQVEDLKRQVENLQGGHRLACCVDDFDGLEENKPEEQPNIGDHA